MKKVLRPCLVVIGVLSILALAGCGGAAAPSPTATPEPKAAANPPQASQPAPTAKKDFKFAMGGAYKPFNYMQGGQLVGFDVDIGMEISKRMDVNGVPVTNPWETILEGLKSGKYDAIIGSMAITEKRKEQVNFSRPYYRSGAQIFVAKNNTTIKGPDDLKGKKVGVVMASTFKDIADKLTDPDKVVGYGSDVIALQDLPTSRLDAVITDQIVGYSAIKDNNVAIKDVGKPLFVDQMAIPVRKEDTQLLSKINGALEAMIKDGAYLKISEKWFGRSILGE